MVAKTHPKGNTYICKQEERIMNIEKGVATIVKKIDNFCDNVDDLTHKFNDALFPSDVHPDNGLIGGVQRLKKEMAEANNKIGKYEDANIITNLDIVKQEISKAKIWISAIVGLAVALFTAADILIKIYVK